MPKPRRQRAMSGRAATTRRTPRQTKMRTVKKPPVSKVGTIHRIISRSRKPTNVARQLGLQ